MHPLERPTDGARCELAQTSQVRQIRHRPWRRYLGWTLSVLLTLTMATFHSSAEEEANVEETPSTTFVETVTVSSTRSERSIKETPGQIDVINSSEIEELGYTNVTDLVRFAPGVYIDGDLTRLGTSGFNIRGIGGNRVLTQIDGVPTAEQFDFGPFSVQQYSLDLESLESVEIVRSAGSALYGSDALGGVVSLVTRSPRSYLGQDPQHFGLRAGYDDRSDELSESLVYARGDDRWQGSMVYTHRDGSEWDNQGDIESEDFTRTAPNPIDRTQDNVLIKLGHSASQGSQFELSGEWFDGSSETEAFSSRNPGSIFASGVVDSDTDDQQNRLRLRVENSLVLSTAVADSLIWRAYWQDADTEQVVDELRTPQGRNATRDGLLGFEQETVGAELEARKALGGEGNQVLTYGFQLRRDHFDGLRDRTDIFLDTGEAVPTTLVFPTKYFPESEVDELGVFLQGELSFAEGRVRLVPGLRFDRYDLNPNEQDTVFLAGNPGQEIAAITDEAISPKLGLVVALNDNLSAFAQYAGGFRAPPMSSVNNGFTNPAGGYRTLPSPDLEPETSDNFELGFRGSFGKGSFSITAFENQYDDFIESVFLGFNPAVFLVEFQSQNINEVEISGIEAAADVSWGNGWRLRGAYSYSDGDNVTDDEPLESIAPSRLVAGLRYAPAGAIWGAELNATSVQSKDASDLPSTSTQFQTPSYEVFDLAAWVHLGDHVTLQLSGWNLTDETYWQWGFVRGQSQTSTTLDRFTSPGRTFGLQVRTSF